jgi:aconitate hydratase
MDHDNKMIGKFYADLPERTVQARRITERPLTLTEKILYSHIFPGNFPERALMRGIDHAVFAPDRVAMQDATAQMALLQFMLSGRDSSCIPASIHCDHLITASAGAEKDLADALVKNREIYDFLSSAADKYDLDFREPGSGIIHQVIFENYAFPGGMIVGTDSHTPAAGGLGMIAVGAGGADAVDVMTGMPWELRWPLITGVRLTGKLNGWTSPKDLILKLTGMLTVNGGTGSVLEYFGEGCRSISATGKASICNMGAETGATCSIFGFDSRMKDYLDATGRTDAAELASGLSSHLNADPEVWDEPEKYFDRVIEIDLSSLEPHVNGPFSPDISTPVSKLKEVVASKGWPDDLSAALIGSCTNSSYQYLSRSASVIRFALENNIPVKSDLMISPGSREIMELAERDGFLEIFRKAGAVIFASACGPCIGQWKRTGAESNIVNSIIHSFNRNFAKRADGNPSTHAFVASSEIVAALAVAGELSFNPLTDELTDSNGNRIKLPEPQGEELPVNGFTNRSEVSDKKAGHANAGIIIDPGSERLQLLDPFPEWDGNDFCSLSLLIKTTGKCTTDHISPAGKWLKYRGHLENISKNYMSGAVNFFTGLTGSTLNIFTGEYDEVHNVARYYKSNGKGSVVAGDENFGEGSSREHAAMEPRFLNVKAVVAISFARIHETNLKKQGLLALSFPGRDEYDKIREDDIIDIKGLENFAPGRALTMVLNHSDGTTDEFPVSHSYNKTQIEWFRAGSALNLIRKKTKNDLT